MLKEGQIAPEISFLDTTNETRSLQDYIGQNVIVYFYPKDDTPGCTTEACNFRDNIDRLAERDTVVFGVSRDSLKSHQKFKQKYDLNFILLSDPELTVHKAFGALDNKKTLRSTFLIDKTGTIKKVWPQVKVEGHIEDLLASI